MFDSYSSYELNFYWLYRRFLYIGLFQKCSNVWKRQNKSVGKNAFLFCPFYRCPLWCALLHYLFFINWNLIEYFNVFLSMSIYCCQMKMIIHCNVYDSLYSHTMFDSCYNIKLNFHRLYQCFLYNGLLQKCSNLSKRQNKNVGKPAFLFCPFNKYPLWCALLHS